MTKGKPRDEDMTVTLAAPSGTVYCNVPMTVARRLVALKGWKIITRGEDA